MSNRLPRHGSVTHLHLFSCLNTLLEERLATRKDLGALRILDIGCGDGRLVSYLYSAFRALTPDNSIELYGVDVREQGWGSDKEYLRAVGNLEKSFPCVPWRERLRLISAQESWPFPDGYFDAAVSNLVLEHVENPDVFLASLRRTLKSDGSSVHVFPLSHCWQEGHVQVPLAHWFRDVESQGAWINLANRLGLGRWRTDKTVFGETDLARYADRQAAYIQSNTFYRSFAEIHASCRKNGLALSHRLTRNLFTAKVREVLRLPPRLRYRRKPILGIDSILFFIFRYLSASTLIITPVNYDISSRIHAEARARAAVAAT